MEFSQNSHETYEKLIGNLQKTLAKFAKTPLKLSGILQKLYFLYDIADCIAFKISSSEPDELIGIK